MTGLVTAAWAGMPFLAVVTCQAASNQVVRGVPGLVEDRARGHAGLVTTGAAHEATPARPPGLTGRAQAGQAKPSCQRLEVAQARLFTREHLDEVPVRYGIVDAGHEPTSQVKLIRWSVHHYILG